MKTKLFIGPKTKELGRILKPAGLALFLLALCQTRNMVDFVACMNAIDEADIFFAFIDQDDCFGTLAEVGFAFARFKEIWIVFENGELKNRLWFAESASIQSGGQTRISPDPKTEFGKILEGFFKEKLLKTMTYSDYLKTEHWGKIKKAVIEQYGGKCSVCNAGGCVDCHHRTYKNRGEEKDGDVILLCRACHAKFHDKEITN